MKQLERMLSGWLAAGCLAMLGGSSALAARPEAPIPTVELVCNDADAPLLTSGPALYRVHPSAGVRSYRLKFTTSYETGSIGGWRPGVRGDGDFDGVDFVFPYGLDELTYPVSPGEGRLWKPNRAGEDSLATSVRLLCR